MEWREEMRSENWFFFFSSRNCLGNGVFIKGLMALKLGMSFDENYVICHRFFVIWMYWITPSMWHVTGIWCVDNLILSSLRKVRGNLGILDMTFPNWGDLAVQWRRRFNYFLNIDDVKGGRMKAIGGNYLLFDELRIFLIRVFGMKFECGFEPI